MKSSWKKQRLAAKKRSINKNKWIRRALREYGFKSTSELSEKLAQVILVISKTLAKVSIGMERWFKNNMIMEDKSLNCSHKWKPTDSYLIDICEYCGIKQAKAALNPNLGSVSTPSAAPSTQRNCMHTERDNVQRGFAARDKKTS